MVENFSLHPIPDTLSPSCFLHPTPLFGAFISGAYLKCHQLLQIKISQFAQKLFYFGEMGGNSESEAFIVCFRGLMLTDSNGANFAFTTQTLLHLD
jgi:hypothetical protein